MCSVKGEKKPSVESLPHGNVTQAECKRTAFHFAQWFPLRGNLIDRELVNIKFVVSFKRLFDSSNNSPCVHLNNPLHTLYEKPPRSSESHRYSLPTDAHRGVNSPGIINAEICVLLGCNATTLVIWFPTFLYDAKSDTASQPTTTETPTTPLHKSRYSRHKLW
jgi:hypothetical protein